jgi:hypothetical protein
VGVLPPMHELARMAGLELPEFLGELQREGAPKGDGSDAVQSQASSPPVSSETSDRGTA